jgi:SAM-dependent methyltransferase
MHLSGQGLELGPGHQPMRLPDRARVRYVDRWMPDENRALYPELPADAAFPVPDLVANFDVDRLHAVPSRSQDFVVCSHVLEHLAEPIGFLDEIHRVLRPDGRALVLLPDRHLTFDRDRAPTALAHLVAEYHDGVTSVSDAHIVEFLDCAGSEAAYLDVRDLDWHRARSIHVHCWDREEFAQVLDYCAVWSVIDEGAEGMEFGWVLAAER